MKEWLCTSKEEMTREAEARSWDETVDNVWHRIAMCDHLLEFKTWRHDDPKPLRGISYATATRPLRILRKRLEKLMGKSAWKGDPPWSDLPKQQWELLWQGEAMWKKHGARIWDAGHKTVTLFRGTIQAYLNLVDWRHIQEGGPLRDAKDWATSLEFTQWQEQQAGKAIPSQEVDELIRGLIYEPSSPILLEGLEEVKELLKDETPVSWLRKILEEELWEEEQF